LLDSRAVLAKISLPLAWVALAALLAEALAALILLGLVLLVLVALGQLKLSALWLVAAAPGLLLLVYGLGLILAVVTVFLEDMREVVQVALQLGFWLTPVVYLPEVLPAWAQGWLALNPAAWAVEAFHAALVFGQAPKLSWLVGLWGVGALALGLGGWLMRRTEKAVRDLL
jgi:lipopolysaccharide transport system permease protein